MSTPMFAEYAKVVGGKLHTCDISRKNIENAKKFTKKYSEFIKFYIQDSVEFLNNFETILDQASNRIYMRQKEDEKEKAKTIPGD